MIIRPARYQEHLQIGMLMIKYVQEDDIGIPFAKEWRLKAAQSTINTLRDIDNQCMFVAVEDDAIVGMATAIISRYAAYSQPTGTVGNLYVLPKYRGGRAGTLLSDAAFEWLDTKGIDCKIVFVRPEKANNHCYKSRGFITKSSILIALEE